jgi:hypothetical protein
VIGPSVAEYLLEHGWVTRAQIDEARRTQGFFGGQLESHLLKLGYVSEAVLGEALTEVSGVPFASWQHLRAAPQAALDAIPERLIERFRVCPFRLEAGRLRVATLNPGDAVAAREIQAATGHVVEPWIATEPRLYQALERHYRMRFEGTKGISLAPGTGPQPRVRPERDEEAAPAATPAEPEVGLDGRPLDAEPSMDDYDLRRPAWAADPGPSRSAAEGVLPANAGGAGPAAEHAGDAPMAALSEALAAALDRDEIAAALFAFFRERALRVGLFAVGKDAVRGIAGNGRAFETARLKGVSVPLGSATIFDTALQSRDFYFGVVPAFPANRDLYTALGGRLPVNVMLLPIVVKDRTVALLYLDADDGPMARPDIPAMRRVAAKAGLAFELLLIKIKLREI